jgi:hypothetical protein
MDAGFLFEIHPQVCRSGCDLFVVLVCTVSAAVEEGRQIAEMEGLKLMDFLNVAIKRGLISLPR